MDPVPLISCRQQSKQLGSQGHMLLGTNLVSSKFLSMFPSFKVGNLVKNDAQLLQGVLFRLTV